MEPKMCELCEVNEADLEFNCQMPVVGKPEDIELVVGFICLDCYANHENDEEIAEKLREKGKKDDGKAG